METKRSDVREVAIGTNIEYDGKLYKVIEEHCCNECALAYV